MSAQAADSPGKKTKKSNKARQTGSSPAPPADHAPGGPAAAAEAGSAPARQRPRKRAVQEPQGASGPTEPTTPKDGPDRTKRAKRGSKPGTASAPVPIAAVVLPEQISSGGTGDPSGTAADTSAADGTDPELDDDDLVALDDPGLIGSTLADPDLSDPEEEADPLESVAVALGTQPVQAATTSAAPRESRWSSRDRERERELISMMAALPADDPQRAAARDELVRMHMPLAAFLARRFRDRGEHLDDLTQVATVGLIKAVDRFEPGRGVEFSTFATPTIVGEIKRHFRDKGWAIRVPRRLQEMRLAITRATAELSQSQGTSPTVAQLAAHLKMSEEEILEGLESAAAYATVSLDSGGSGEASEDGGASIAETVGDLDPNLAEVDNRATLHPLLASLGEREQRIVYMRFFENKTQAQIAEEIGVSQMHISRLLAKSLAQMRTDLSLEA